MRRLLSGTVGSACLGLMFCACAESEDREAVATAACSLPVFVDAGFSLPDGSPVGPQAYLDGAAVENLGTGNFRVTGTAFQRRDSEIRKVQYVCEVAPDKSDQLRGFRVTHLDVVATP